MNHSQIYLSEEIQNQLSGACFLIGVWCYCLAPLVVKIVYTS